MMDLHTEAHSPAGFAGELRSVAALLGGERVLHHVPEGAMDAHLMLLEGLPGTALTHLIDGLRTLHRTESLEKAVGISLRTFQRRKDAPEKPLSVEQSGRVWKFAEILSQATRVLGSQEAAEQWLERPAIGLDQQRPIDLLATPAGVDLVETYLQRMYYAVYA
jgi:putative toxin-antitoxin system antitoxin component (TIGR02293 family)